MSQAGRVPRPGSREARRNPNVTRVAALAPARVIASQRLFYWEIFMPEKTVEDLKAETAPFTAKKEKLDAQTSLEKAPLDAKKDLAEARMNAGVAEAKAAIGAVTGPPGITPSVTAGTEAGKGEAILLAAAATREAAQLIAKTLETKIHDRDLVLLLGAESGAFSNYLQFTLQLRVLDAQFERAQEDANALERKANALAHRQPNGVARPQVAATPALGGASLLL
ncbi:MAG: hypothetical protein JO273_02410, partial [Methylobacteriaceae bacterium]|nr:hypothetical protein [Methylobacteriaceae bacterium]